MSISAMIGLVGDSDIARWPTEFIPSIFLAESASDGVVNKYDDNCKILVSGQSGATLDEILPQVKDTITALLRNSSVEGTSKFVIVCAGENDIGCGIPLHDSIEQFQSLVDIFCQKNFELSERKSRDNMSLPLHLIFLGPKFEPWQTNDDEARKSYIQMSSKFKQICQRSMVNNNKKSSSSSDGFIHYIDCLTMFCDSSSVNRPGAIYGGKAIPDKQYFHSDGLHLSDNGYQIWKFVIEDKISTILRNLK